MLLFMPENVMELVILKQLPFLKDFHNYYTYYNYFNKKEAELFEEELLHV